MEVISDCLPIILSRFGTSSMERFPLFERILNVAQTAVCILLKLTLGEVVCMIQKSFRLIVRLIDIFQNLYLGNTVQIIEGSVCVVVVEFPVNKLQSFGGIFKCVFQLQDHSMLWCPGLTFGRFECARQHMVHVMKVLAILLICAQWRCR
jgi:hypothetical protein